MTMVLSSFDSGWLVVVAYSWTQLGMALGSVNTTLFGVKAAVPCFQERECVQ